MGITNYLIEGVSGSGKTSVASELQQRGYYVIHGDRELAYQGDPETGEPLDQAAKDRAKRDAAFGHGYHIWDVEKVRSLVADRSHPATFFCGGSRNWHRFIHLFDAVFVLDLDKDTLEKRLDDRPSDEFGAKPAERAIVLRVHATQEDIPKDAMMIDATAPLDRVVDDILANVARSAKADTR